MYRTVQKWLLERVRKAEEPSDYRVMIGTILGTLTWSLFLASGLMVFLCTPMRLLNVSVAAAVGIGLVMFAIAVRAGIVLRNDAQRMNGMKRASRYSLILILMFGVLLRVAWVCLVPSIQMSDFLDYWQAARGLLETGTYSSIFGGQTLLAWRPPGYPFLLALCMAVVGPKPWIPAVTNIILYLLASISSYLLARKLAGERAALLAAFLFAISPSNVSITGLAATEPLSLFFFVASTLAFVTTVDYGWRAALIAGTLSGLTALVRPNFLLVPVLWIYYVIIDRRRRWSSLSYALLAILAMTLTIAPWTIRNYRVLGELVPISTNGGDNFYRANNPLATGGYTARGERNLGAYLGTEVLWNRMGYAWGMEWIRENPADFLKLAVRKQMLFLGNDTDGVYWSLKIGQKDSGPLYLLLSGLANAWWLGVWILAVMGAVCNRDYLVVNPVGSLLLWTILLWVILHSIFESQSRYHIPFLGLLVIAAAMSIYSPRHQVGQEADSPNAVETSLC